MKCAIIITITRRQQRPTRRGSRRCGCRRSRSSRSSRRRRVRRPLRNLSLNGLKQRADTQVNALFFAALREGLFAEGHDHLERLGLLRGRECMR